MKVLIPLICFFIVSSVNAQIVNPNSNYAKPKPLPKKTSVEIQAIQTRTFETSEKKLFRATLKVLQNNRYKDIISDFDGGIITAKLSFHLPSVTLRKEWSKSLLLKTTLLVV